jgi:DNA-binding NarL/FixJ family response regulator
MRVVLVGSSAERARLRARIDGATFVIGEFDSLAEARVSALEPDALLLAPWRRLRSRAGTARSAGELPEEPLEVVEDLTPREVQVLELLAEGLPNKAIAGRLGISDQTVKFHVAAITGKLGAVNRTDAVRRAVRRGLISL